MTLYSLYPAHTQGVSPIALTQNTWLFSTGLSSHTFLGSDAARTYFPDKWSDFNLSASLITVITVNVAKKESVELLVQA